MRSALAARSHERANAVDEPCDDDWRPRARRAKQLETGAAAVLRSQLLQMRRSRWLSLVHCTGGSMRHARIWAVALALLAALAVAAPASASAPRSKVERMFLVDMVGHHAMAVDMAEMAKEKATHQELKDMADDVIRTQTAEIERMRSWLKRWYDRSVGDEHMGHDEDMQMLEEATGAEFEVRFLAMMSVHHTQAIERSRAVRHYRLHGKVRKLTKDIIRAQMREVDQMQEWLVAWYAN
jgi:uncharacterized protein (DUF305 family)